jgi:hypothetical protein
MGKWIPPAVRFVNRLAISSRDSGSPDLLSHTFHPPKSVGVGVAVVVVVVLKRVESKSEKMPNVSAGQQGMTFYILLQRSPSSSLVYSTSVVKWAAGYIVPTWSSARLRERRLQKRGRRERGEEEDKECVRRKMSVQHAKQPWVAVVVCGGGGFCNGPPLDGGSGWEEWSLIIALVFPWLPLDDNANVLRRSGDLSFLLSSSSEFS